jgi:hypothetical protein
MVITAHIDKWDVTRVLFDNDSQAEILFLSTFKRVGFDRKELKEHPSLYMVMIEEELNQQVPYRYRYLSVAFATLVLST